MSGWKPMKLGEVMNFRKTFFKISKWFSLTFDYIKKGVKINLQEDA